MQSILAFIVLVLAFSGEAHAYIDPGAGSMLLQVVIGAVLGAVYWFRGWIVALFKKIFRR